MSDELNFDELFGEDAAEVERRVRAEVDAETLPQGPWVEEVIAFEMGREGDRRPYRDPEEMHDTLRAIREYGVEVSYEGTRTPCGCDDPECPGYIVADNEAWITIRARGDMIRFLFGFALDGAQADAASLAMLGMQGIVGHVDRDEVQRIMEQQAGRHRALKALNDATFWVATGATEEVSG